jgi:hypothetical protein
LPGTASGSLFRRNACDGRLVGLSRPSEFDSLSTISN